MKIQQLLELDSSTKRNHESLNNYKYSINLNPHFDWWSPIFGDQIQISTLTSLKSTVIFFVFFPDVQFAKNPRRRGLPGGRACGSYQWGASSFSAGWWPRLKHTMNLRCFFNGEKYGDITWDINWIYNGYLMLLIWFMTLGMTTNINNIFRFFYYYPLVI